MLKWTWRIAIGLIGVVLVATLVLLIAFAFWIADYKRDLVAGSNIASTSRGEIEYAIAGEGTPMLRLHGRPVGYDAVIAGPRARPDDYAAYKTIAVSRPGYLRTPLSSGRTPAEQADLYAALLDSLGINRVIVYGASGGGPSALQFAIRHPNRTIALILVAPTIQTSAAERARDETP